MPNELKPCPFCGGEASDAGTIRFGESHHAWWSDGTRILKSYYVSCIICGSSNRGLFGHQTKQQATGTWNQRTPDAVEVLKEVKEDCSARIKNHRHCSGSPSIYFQNGLLNAITFIDTHIARLESEK